MSSDDCFGASRVDAVGGPGGLNGRLLGLEALPDDGVDGVCGREIFMADAGRAGGPIDPLLFTVLERRLEGEGAGEICERVSVVLSDSDSLGFRLSALEARR